MHSGAERPSSLPRIRLAHWSVVGVSELLKPEAVWSSPRVSRSQFCIKVLCLFAI
jgi:hypothetical protein